MRFLAKIKFRVDDIEQAEFLGLLVFNDEQASIELTRLEKRSPESYEEFSATKHVRIVTDAGEKVIYQEFHSHASYPPVDQFDIWIRRELGKNE